MKIHMVTLGCKVNRYESQAMLEDCVNNGFIKASGPEDADIIVVNSCAVTETSVKKTAKLCRRLRRENPQTVLVLCGCMPQVNPPGADTFKDIDIVMGTVNRKNLVPNINLFLASGKKIIDVAEHEKGSSFEKMSIEGFNERTRAFVKIEDGCENFCTYCIIPFARGSVRSKPAEDIKKELTYLSYNNYREIVLTGINLCAYGEDLHLSLCDAVETAASVAGIDRIRLSSLEPDYFSDSVIKRLAGIKKLCPHFHLSLQSGCDATLARMNRHYDAAGYMRVVDKLRDSFPNCSFTTDVIVGFPGETEEEFNISLSFVKKVGFLRVHVFPYSARKGTIAAAAENQVPEGIKKKRSKLMVDAAALSAEKFLNTQVGTVADVLFERSDKAGYYEGFSSNYCPIKVKTSQGVTGEIRKVRIVGVLGERLTGELK